MIQIPTQPEDTAETSPHELRGLVEHVSSGSRQPFTDTCELLAFLRDFRRLPKEVEP